MSQEQIGAVGRRKEAVARVYIRPGEGKITVNGRGLREFLGRETLVLQVNQPLEYTETVGSFDIRARVNGGGPSGQAGAIRLGIARALVKANEDHHAVLKAKGMLTRDPRMKERKKYGLAGRRKKFQFSKR